MSLGVEEIGFIRGLFTAFEWMNGKTNHGYTFEIDLIPITRSSHEDLVDYFSNVASAVGLEELANWREALSASMSKWLFQFLNDPWESNRLQKDQRFVIFDSQAREELIGIIIEKFATAISVLRAHRIKLQTTGFYECDWDDFVLESTDSLLIIHFGVSD